VTIQKDQNIAQVILERAGQLDVLEVQDLLPTERGEQGFGSTGLAAAPCQAGPCDQHGKKRVTFAEKKRLAEQISQAIVEDIAKRPRQVSDHEMLTVLKVWAFTKNDRRKNVMPEGVEWVHSNSFGLQRRRDGTLSTTSNTLRYPYISRVFNAWLKDRRPDGIHSFPCTTITINSGYAARKHRDGNNRGPSLIRAFRGLRRRRALLLARRRRQVGPRGRFRPGQSCDGHF